MKKIFRAVYAKSPNSARLMMGRMWKVRGAMDRMKISAADMDATFAKTKIFFMLGSGRCGTMFLSRLLNQADDAMVLHEPLRHSDLEVRPACRVDPSAGIDYVEKFRKVQIYKKVKEHGVSIYGECSQPLRCLGTALRHAFPQGHFMILVRNGKAGVRSAMNRQASRGATNHWNHAPVMPLPGDPVRDRWDSMSDFEKACWWWADSYRMLLDQLDGCPIVQFEQTLNDFDYLHEMVLAPVGLNITREQWEAHKARPSDNSATKYIVKHPDEWDQQERDAFEQYAGDVNRAMGYID